MSGTDLIEVRGLAEAELAEELPRRWTHVQSVGTKAERVAHHLLSVEDSRIVEAAAWLHDIGYAPRLHDTGFHPIDGARWLRRNGFSNRIACLVAHHSYASIEAEIRGLADTLLAEFDREPSHVEEVLWYCDLTTGPDGQDFPVEERIAEILTRYSEGDPTTEFIHRVRHGMIKTVHRVENALHDVGYPI